MAEEWFDVVDDADAVIGREVRAEVHRLGLKHRAVHIEVFDQDDRVFVQKRSMSKDTSPGQWDSSASGHVDAGESYDTCALRELGEELGWTPPSAPRRLFRIEARRETGWEFLWVYRAAWDGREFTLHPGEISTGEWCTPADLETAIATRPAAFAGSFRFIWEEMQRRGLIAHGT